RSRLFPLCSDTAAVPPVLYTLSLHDALPIWGVPRSHARPRARDGVLGIPQLPHRDARQRWTGGTAVPAGGPRTGLDSGGEVVPGQSSSTRPVRLGGRRRGTVMRGDRVAVHHRTGRNDLHHLLHLAAASLRRDGATSRQEPPLASSRKHSPASSRKSPSSASSEGIPMTRSQNLKIVIASAGHRAHYLDWFRTALRSQGLRGEVIALEYRESAPSFASADRGVVVPAYNAPVYRETIANWVSRESPDLLISLNDYELQVLS